MPPCPWDVCGGGPGDGLVGFLWDTPKVFGGSRSRSFRILGLKFSGAGSRLSPRAMFAIAAHAGEREAHVREVERFGRSLPEGSYGRRNREAIADRETRVAARLRAIEGPTGWPSTATPRTRRRSPAGHPVPPGVRPTGRLSLSKRPANPYQTIAASAATRCQLGNGRALSPVRRHEFAPAEKPFGIDPRSRATMVRPIPVPDWLVSLGSRHSGSRKRGDPIRIGGVPPGNGTR